MQYADARPLIQSGDLLAYADTGFISRFIRIFTAGSYSHVGIAWRYNDRLYLLQEVEGHGICLVPASHRIPFVWIRTSLIWKLEVETEVLDWLGEDYSYSDAVRVGFGLAPRHAHEVCSVYAAVVLTKLGMLLPKVNSFTPTALVNAVLALGGTLQEVLPDTAS